MPTDEERIATLEYQVRLLAWLHNELVYEIRNLIATLTGPVARNIDPARLQTLRARAARIAQIQAQKTPAQ
ncbi:MAG TPA: hypothetical protein VGF36_02650 [Rhodopila sp.]|jgi:hypothetical protein